MRSRLFVLSLALIALAAACGGSSDAADSADPAGTSSPTASPTTEMDHEAMGHDPADTADDAQDMPISAVAAPLATRPDGIIDPERIDLGGIDGVTPEQQSRAEDLLRRSVETLPRWADVATAEADGFTSIGDGLTGEEHLLQWDWINGDDKVLDPNFPEALVYRVEPDGSRTLDAAMFILPDEYNWENLPDLGGALTQFHIHDNLCFTDEAAPTVAGLTTGDGSCRPPTVKLNPNPMIHVWIRQNSCGPFAALQGVGAGQIKSGEERACDPDHGRLTL